MSDQSSEAGIRRWVWCGLIVACLLSVAAAGITPVIAASGYTIQIDDATDTPPRTIEDPPVLVGDEYEIDAFAVQEPGEEFEFQVTVPADADSAVNETEVEMYNSDQNLVDVAPPDSDGNVVFSSDKMDLAPGTYSLALVDEITEAIHPVVIPGYDVSVANPTEATEDDEITVEATVEERDDAVLDQPPDEVNVVIWNDDTEEQFELSEESDETYTADISLEGLDAGEYNLHVTAHGEEEFRGEKEVMGLEEGTGVTIEEAEDDSGSSDDDNGSGNGSGSDSGDSGAVGGGGGGGVAPVASTSTSIPDETPGEDGVTVTLDQGAVHSVTFFEDADGGSLDVEEYDQKPPGAPDTGDRPVMASVVIAPSEAYQDSNAAFELTVDQTELLRADVTADEVAVLKATDGGYQTLETTVVEANGDVRLRAETDGFSGFIVSTDEGDIDSDTDAETDSTDTEADSTEAETSDADEDMPDDVVEPSDPEEDPAEPEDQPGFVLGSALIALLIALAIAHRQRRE